MSRALNLRQKVALYEGVLHRINAHAAIAMNGERTADLIGRICAWSYAHRCGNGELSPRAQNSMIREAAERMREP